MVTKLIAAELATSAGCSMVISIGTHPQRILEILKEITKMKTDESFVPTIGTHFMAKLHPLVDRKWWLLSGLASYGTLTIDAGAVEALSRHHKSSLFAAGIVGVTGSFNAQQCVRIVTVTKVDEKDVEVEIARGLVNYSSMEISRIKGCKSSDIAEILGYCESEYVIHRDNIVLVNK
jgi:glutamate 5-kinase